MGNTRDPHHGCLPNYEKAVIPREKLERYCLDPEHTSKTYGSNGKDKAYVFRALLGIDQSHWELLRDGILNELPYHEATLGADDEYGQRYNVKVPITGPNGNTAIVLVAWIVRPGSDSPFLVSAYVS